MYQPVNLLHARATGLAHLPALGWQRWQAKRWSIGSYATTHEHVKWSMWNMEKCKIDKWTKCRSEHFCSILIILVAKMLVFFPVDGVYRGPRPRCFSPQTFQSLGVVLICLVFWHMNFIFPSRHGKDNTCQITKKKCFSFILVENNHLNWRTRIFLWFTLYIHEKKHNCIQSSWTLIKHQASSNIIRYFNTYIYIYTYIFIYLYVCIYIYIYIHYNPNDAPLTAVRHAFSGSSSTFEAFRPLTVLRPCLARKTINKWMICGYPHFRKPPCDI